MHYLGRAFGIVACSINVVQVDLGFPKVLEARIVTYLPGGRASVISSERKKRDFFF